MLIRSFRVSYLWGWASADAGLCGGNFVRRRTLVRQLLSEKEGTDSGSHESLQRAHLQCPNSLSVNATSYGSRCLPLMPRSGDPVFTTQDCRGHCRSKLKQAATGSQRSILYGGGDSFLLPAPLQRPSEPPMLRLLKSHSGYVPHCTRVLDGSPHEKS